MSILNTALAWQQAGVSVVRVAADGTKTPVGSWKRNQTVPADREQVATWFVGRDDLGVGVVCGAVSGQLEMVELEGRAVTLATDLATLMVDNGLGDVWDRLTAGCAEMSPAGGLHWFYRVDGPARPNTKLARRPGTEPGTVDVLAETRGEGGFVVVAPSAGAVHPTGKPWLTLRGGPATIPNLTVDERDQMHAVVAMLDQMPAAEPARPVTGLNPGSKTGTRPGDDFNARADWADILTGWTRVKDFRSGWTAWRRPGKTIGISATTGRNDGDNLYVFSTSTELDTERPYTKFHAYTVLTHGGDWSAAAKALAAAGYGSPERPRLSVVPSPATPTDGSSALAPGPATARHAAAYGPTEDGTAQALVAAHGDRIRYCPQRGRWLVWGGHRWEWDEGEQVRELVRAVARGLPEGDGWAAYKKRALSAAGVTGIVRLAQTDAQVTVHVDALDARPYQLNTPGGIIDLRTGTLSSPDPVALHTRTTTVAPDFDRAGQLWDRFLADTFADPKLSAFVARLVGLSVIGTVLEQILLFGHGSGANGKSTLLETAMAAIGQGETGYSISAPSEMLMVRKHSEHPTEIAQLAGTRMVVCSELDEGQRFAEARIKHLTGRDSINARFMRRDPFTFTPTHTLWLHGNKKPDARTGGPAFWRRVHLIPFDHVVPVDQRDTALGEKLFDELPAVLGWIVRGAADYMTGGLQVPGAVTDATADYAHDQDTVARFVDEMCHLAPGQSSLRVTMAAVRAAYETWCTEVGETPVSAKRLGSELRDRFGAGDVKSNGRRFYTGLGLVTDRTLDDDEDSGERGWFR